MLQNKHNQYGSTCDALKNRIIDHKYKIKISSVNEENIRQYKEKIQHYHDRIILLDRAKSYLSPIVKDITEYLGERKKQSLHSINSAIRMVAEIVPSAMPNIQLQIKGDEAWLETSDGMLVRLSEGAGYKSILSAFLRTITVGSNPLNLQTIIFDEIFAKLSVENSATLSIFLPIMAHNMQIISIEQKPEVYANVDYINYEFIKQDGYTIIQKEVVHNGSNLSADTSAGNEVPVQNNAS